MTMNTIARSVYWVGVVAMAAVPVLAAVFLASTLGLLTGAP